MRRRGHRALALVAASAAVAATAASGVAASGGKGTAVPSRLLVTGREYSLSLSRPKVKAGQAIVQLYDYGEDPHNLVLQRVGSNRQFTTGVVEPGDTGEVRLKLRKRSRYQLFCSLADHAQRGMTAALRTTRH
jgi:hypothetical protein